MDMSSLRTYMLVEEAAKAKAVASETKFKNMEAELGLKPSTFKTVVRVVRGKRHQIWSKWTRDEYDAVIREAMHFAGYP